MTVDFGDYGSITEHLEAALTRNTGREVVQPLEVSKNVKPLMPAITACLSVVWDNFQIAPSAAKFTAREGGEEFVRQLFAHLNHSHHKDGQAVLGRLRKAVGFLIQEALV